ncbi:hypothetical protein IW262DRAFT_1300775 [Armillaria fumosa]|nr:hypothetical protein IW262DRAFT_1300775 [Armillaria fumosa]
MFLLQWLLKALRQVLCGQPRGRLPLTSILLLARFFRRLSHTRDDGASDQHTQDIAEQVSHLPQGEPVLDVVCRSTALPNDLRSSHDMAPMSVASHSQAGLAFETDLNPSNGYSPLNGSRLSSITPSSIEGHLSTSSNLSQLSQGISGTAYNLAADAHLNSSDIRLPHTGPAPGQGWLLSNSKAAATPQLPTGAQRDGQNQADVAESMLHDRLSLTGVFGIDFLDNVISYICAKGIILPPKVDLFWALDRSQKKPDTEADGVQDTFKLFPACQEMTSDTIEEVNDFLLYCITETRETTSTAQYGFTLSELQQYLTVVNNIRSSIYTVGEYQALSKTEGQANAAREAWLLGHRSHDLYIHFHGEPGTRRGARHKPETVQRSHTPLIVLLSPLLFFAPDVHCTTLYRVWDNGVAKADWIALIRKLSLLLLQKYRHKNSVYSTLPTEFLGIQQGDLGRRLGIETLAIMYSLPWALLMWAILPCSALLVNAIVIFWYLTVSRERCEQRWYMQAYAHLVKAWIPLPRRLSALFPAKFNLWMGSNDVEMTPMGSHTTASLDNDALTSRSSTRIL